MATITQQIQSIYLSSQLPDKFFIRTNDPSVSVSVNVGSEEYFTTTLYAYNGMAYLHDIRSIVEQALFEDSNQLNTVTVTATDTDSTASISFTVIYCDLAIQLNSRFLDTHFLTTRNAYTIHPDAYQWVYWFARNGGIYSKRIDAVVKIGETTQAVSISQNAFNATMDDVISETVRPSDIMTLIRNGHPELEQGKLLAFTLHRGGHHLTFYITEETPDINLAFCNAFNAMERVSLHAVTHRKQKTTQLEANILRDFIQYDRQTEHTYEVETAALSPDEATYLEQPLRSPYIELLIDNNIHPVILITDFTSEISDSDNEQIRIKFTYKMADNAIPFIPPATPQIFTQDFQPPFQ